ncbi:hypothetical protein GHT06_011137 [Daphnia sinensis]|uniref:SUN domain-containing protein n=1 Tax=Daphnia sinensis TaxID=1820382 RepID=A0AAD5LTF0_9CRUS|nr:hypothetical protein GHT06_011137 [Daphnia sinensis]
MRSSVSPSPTVGYIIIYCLVSLSLSSNQNDAVSSRHVIENEVQPPKEATIHLGEKENVDSKELSRNIDNLDSVEVSPVVTADNSHQRILPTTEHPIVSEDNLTSSEVTVRVENEDAELFVPIVEVLTTPENEEETLYAETSVNEVILAEAESVVQLEKDLGTANVLNVTNNVTRNNESGSSEDDIPSFSEWTLKVLAEEEKSGANGSSGVQTSVKISATPKLRQKNYASPDCGAKILAANSEAEHTSAILDPSRDEYFLSICSAKIWFVIELCEAIQAQRVGIANFELFSSSPKDFRVYISDRYPTRDWALIGLFTAADERSIQSFTLERQLFGKFVKVELVSHHGKEHFCPISLFHVYGNSEYEVLDNEEDSRSGSISHRHEEDSTEEEMLFDLLQNNSSNSDVVVEGRNLFGSAKDAVINIVKKAAEVLTKSPAPHSVMVSTNETKKNEEDNRTTCYTAIESVNVSRSVNGSLSCEWKELTFLSSLSWLQPSIVRQCQAEASDQVFSSVELAFAQSIWKPSTIQALCHFILPEESHVSASLESVIPLISEFELPENLIPCSEVPQASEAESHLDEQPSAEQSELESLEQLFAEEMDTSPEEMPIGVEVKLGDGFIIEPSKPISVQQQEQQQKEQQQHQEQQQQRQNKEQQQQQQQSKEHQQLQQQQGRQQQTQKESVFVRLSNRIKVLERNMSLSGQYLEELSRRYKRQVDDMQKSLNRTLQTLNDTLQRMSTQEAHYQLVLSQLHGDMAELKTSAIKLAEENVALRAQTIEQHLFLMVVEVIVIAVLVVFLLHHFNRPQPNPPPNLGNSPIHRQKDHQPAPLDFRLEVGQKVEEVEMVKQTSQMSLKLSEKTLQPYKTKMQASPTPSVADSSSSGCESAFSFPNSNCTTTSRDPSPVDGIKARSKSGKASSKKQQKKKKHSLSFIPSDKTSIHHTKDARSATMHPPKIRLKSDNWEWHSRAKILAAQFIKENYQTTGMRSSF